GEIVFPIKLSDEEIILNDKKYNLNWLQKQMNGKFLIQSKIKQHEKINQFYAHSVNTIRLLTINNNGIVKALSAFMKFSINNSRQEYFIKNLNDSKVESHPNTFEKFQDFKIPFYNESCELAINLHESLYGIHSIGWDIAITPDGPLIIKGNDNWNVAMQQLFYKKEIKKRI